MAIEDKIRAWLNAGEAQGNGGVKRRGEMLLVIRITLRSIDVSN